MLNGNQSTVGGISSLSELGISFQKDGTLALDNNKLSAALNDPDENIAAFFTTQLESADSFASCLGDPIDNMICNDGLKVDLKKTTDGALATRLDQLYNYITVRLFIANKISQLLGELQEIRISIGKQPVGKTDARTTASPAIKQTTETGATA